MQGKAKLNMQQQPLHCRELSRNYTRIDLHTEAWIADNVVQPATREHRHSRLDVICHGFPASHNEGYGPSNQSAYSQCVVGGVLAVVPDQLLVIGVSDVQARLQ